MILNVKALSKVIVFMLVLTFAAPYFRGHKQPLCAGEIQYISTQTLKQMYDESRAFTLVNVLPKVIFDAMHLPGSVNYPIGRLEAAKNLSFPKNKPLIFYCMGVL
jgi:hypothetical protein